MERLFDYLYVGVVVVLLFGASIFVHESGHFLVALWRRMRVEAFAIGLGPRIWACTRRGIEYSVRWIPAGGFVKLPQMITSEAFEGASDSKEPIPPAPPGSKILVAVAGPLMNVIFAFAVATVIYFVGLPVLVNPSLVGKVDPDSEEAKLGIQEGDRIVAVSGKPVKSWEEISTITVLAPSNTFNVKIERDGVSHTYTLRAKVNEVVGLKWLNLEPLEHPVAGAVESGWPAASAGLEPGDEFVSVNGVPVLSREHVIELVSKNEGKPVELVVNRENRHVTLEMTPRMDNAQDPPRARIGVMFAGGVYEVLKPGPTPWQQVKKVWERTIGVLGALINSKNTGVKPKDLSGPIGILGALAIQTKTDFRLALDFLVLLNINLAILNLLPIPVLDGGHVVMSILEKVRGRPLSLRFVEVTTTAFALLLIGFMLYVSFFDVRRVPLFKAMFDSTTRNEQIILPAPTNAAPESAAPAE